MLIRDEEVALEIPNTVTGIRVEVLSYRLLHKNTLFGLVEIPRAQFGVCMYIALGMRINNNIQIGSDHLNYSRQKKIKNVCTNISTQKIIPQDKSVCIGHSPQL